MQEKPGRKLRKLSEKIATTGSHVFVAAFSGLRGSKGESKLPELPPGLRLQPQGELSVPLPVGNEAWAEAFRDLSRVLQGGCVFVIGRQRLYPLHAPSPSAVGRMDDQTSSAALELIAASIRDELLAQGVGLSATGNTKPTPWRRSGSQYACGSAEMDRLVDPQILKELSLQVAAHVSVGPGVQLTIARGLPPALWQPTFTLCIGDGQVRVLTFAFVGAPVTGDRPDRKRTPFCLRIATGDLVRAASRSVVLHRETCEARKKREPLVPSTPRGNAASVWYAAEAVRDDVNTTLDYIVSLEDELFGAIEDGSWSGLLGCEEQDDGGPAGDKGELAEAVCALSGLPLSHAELPASRRPQPRSQTRSQLRPQKQEDARCQPQVQRGQSLVMRSQKPTHSKTPFRACSLILPTPDSEVIGVVSDRGL